jgi:hypothetical protein
MYVGARQFQSDHAATFKLAHYRCRRRVAYRALIEADATALIERFGELAYSEARFRQHDEVVDANRPAGHWERVKEAIRRIETRR